MIRSRLNKYNHIVKQKDYRFIKHDYVVQLMTYKDYSVVKEIVEHSWNGAHNKAKKCLKAGAKTIISVFTIR